MLDNNPWKRIHERKKTKKMKENKELKVSIRLLLITKFWTDTHNLMLWLGASWGDPRRNISVVRLMGTLI